MATFIKSQMGGQKLIYHGFIYIKNRNGANGQTYWKCEQHRSTKCPASAITDANNEVTITKLHSHPPSPNRVELAQIKSRINQAALTTPIAPRTIINQQLAGVSDQAKATLPKLVNLQKTVSRKRRANGQQFAIPQTLAEINIPAQLGLTKTANPENFVLADTGPADPARIIIFASRTDVARLASCDVWVVDGTFKSAPQLFYQLWVIHGRYRQASILPFIYALLPSKRRECYQRTLQLIVEKIDEINPNARPNTIIIDFEESEKLAIETVLPTVRLHGCYFHFMQCIWRNIQKANLATRYLHPEEVEFRTILKMFAALTFVDIANVRTWFRELAHTFLDVYGDEESHFKFIDYMERTWIGREFYEAKFPLEMWNNKNITMDQMPRTSNSAESWHNAFASVFSRHHPNPYKLLDALLDEQVRVDTLAVRIAAGFRPPLFSKDTYRQKNENLLNVLRDVGGPQNPIEFLTSCSYYISFNT